VVSAAPVPGEQRPAARGDGVCAGGRDQPGPSPAAHRYLLGRSRTGRARRAHAFPGDGFVPFCLWASFFFLAESVSWTREKLVNSLESQRV